MRKMKKLLCAVLTSAMVLAMAAPSFAQNVSGNGADSASITVKNASKGIDYSVYKLFDATVTGTDGGSIAYTGTIPATLTNYFSEDSVGNISVKDGIDQEVLFTALKTWAETEGTAVATATSDGSELTFDHLDYGYYVVTTTQGAAITVNSTNPEADIYDKNSTVPGNNVNKDANNTDVSIGDTVTYTVTFGTANYDGEGADAEKILSYTIHDTLPEGFLSNVVVDSIKIGGADYKVNDAVPQFNNNEITIPWVADVTNANSDSLYNNGATIEIVYHATVNATAGIDGTGNANTVTVTWAKGDGTTGGDPDINTSTETIYTYALAIQKVDANGNPLAGAEFSIAGITVDADPANEATMDGDYTVTASGDNLNTGALKCDNNGVLIIRGVKNQNYIVTETTAPNGYNKLEGTITVPVTKTGETTTTTTKYIDESGNITDEVTNTEVTYTNNDLAATVAFVVNQTGAMLPSTGGIGTTIFYAAGIILMAGAVFFVVRRKRA